MESRYYLFWTGIQSWLNELTTLKWVRWCLARTLPLTFLFTTFIDSIKNTNESSTFRTIILSIRLSKTMLLCVLDLFKAPLKYSISSGIVWEYKALMSRAKHELGIKLEEIHSFITNVESCSGQSRALIHTYKVVGTKHSIILACSS